MNRFLQIALVCLFLSIVPNSFAQSSKQTPANFEFVNQNISDVLYALSTYTKTSIVADDTVTGPVTFQFAGGNFEKAFDTFLTTNRLFVEKSLDLWTVSKIKITVGDNALVSLDALDVTPAQLIDKIAMKTNTTIVQDIMPSPKISLHIDKLAVVDTIEIIMKPYPDYTVTKQEKYIQIKKQPIQASSLPLTQTGTIKIRETGGLFDVTCEKAKLGDILVSFFGASKKEYSSFVRGDQIIERLSFSGKQFKESLDLILGQANANAIESNAVWFILPLQQSDVFKKIMDDGKSWNKFTLKYIATKDCVSYLQNRFPGISCISLPDGVSLLLYISDGNRNEVQDYIRTIDTATKSEPIRLKYITTEALFKALPPSVKREELIDSGNGNTIFFLGGDDKKSRFIKDLETIDRPYTRIRYDLLIIQSQESFNLTWGFNVDATQLAPGDMNMVTGSLGKMLSLNFDAISVFGYNFAGKLNLALTDNQAKVFADTTLSGLSGQEIKFQNTDTYRYRDYYIDANTGKTVYTGVTREITSGLILNINGWASGDGMITTTVTASVSKRGADSGTVEGNPPATSEKVITTHVRSRSGEPIVLSGLKQNDSSIAESSTPGISKIPIIGWLFKNRTTTKQESQMVIYLVPHIDVGSDEYTDMGLRTQSAYNRFVAPYIGRKE